MGSQDQTGLTVSHVVEVDVSVAQRAPGHRVSAHSDGRHGANLRAQHTAVSYTISYGGSPPTTNETRTAA